MFQCYNDEIPVFYIGAHVTDTFKNIFGNKVSRESQQYVHVIKLKNLMLCPSKKSN